MTSETANAPRPPKKRSRPKVLFIHVTEDEHARCMQGAEARHLSLSEWARRVLLGELQDQADMSRSST